MHTCIFNQILIELLGSNSLGGGGGEVSKCFFWNQPNGHTGDTLSNLFVCFVALCPKTTALVMGGTVVHLTTLFPGHA